MTIVLDLTISYISFLCVNDDKCKVNVYGNFGFKTLSDAHYTLRLLLLIFYSIISLGHIWLFFKLKSMFILIFPKIYEQINNKLIPFFIIFELLMISRLTFYIFILYDIDISSHNI